MSFFDKILQGLGFEGEEKQNQNSEPREIEPEEVEKFEEIENTEVTDNTDLEIQKLFDNAIQETNTNQEVNVNNNIKRKIIKIKPTSQAEVEGCLTQLKLENNLMIDLSAFNEHDIFRAMDFIAGYCKCLNANIKKIDRHTFLLEIK